MKPSLSPQGSHFSCFLYACSVGELEDNRFALASATTGVWMTGQEQHDFYKVNSLTNLDKASPVEGAIVWDAPRSLWNGAMLLGAIVLGPLTFSWSALAVFLVTAAITLCAGHSVGFHRRLIHRSFECSKWLERTLVWFGTAVGMGGPLWTIRLHA